MSEINQKQFSALCYLVLMDHHGGGYKEAHPSYIEEKLPMLNAEFEAYGYLDRPNQMKVLDYLAKWKFEAPQSVKNYEEELSNL